MKTAAKDGNCGPEKASLRGVTAKGGLSGSKGRGYKGDRWN